MFQPHPTIQSIENAIVIVPIPAPYNTLYELLSQHPSVPLTSAPESEPDQPPQYISSPDISHSNSCSPITSPLIEKQPTASTVIITQPISNPTPTITGPSISSTESAFYKYLLRFQRKYPSTSLISITDVIIPPTVPNKALCQTSFMKQPGIHYITTIEDRLSVCPGSPDSTTITIDQIEHLIPQCLKIVNNVESKLLPD